MPTTEEKCKAVATLLDIDETQYSIRQGDYHKLTIMVVDMAYLNPEHLRKLAAYEYFRDLLIKDNHFGICLYDRL